MTNYAIAFGYALATLTGVFATWRGWRARPGPAARWFVVLMVGATAWSALSLAAVIYGYPVDSVVMLITRLEWAAIGVVGLGMLGGGLALSGRAATLTRRRVAALSVVPAAASVMALSDPRIVDLYVAAVGPLGPLADVFAALSSAWSAFYWVALAYVYLLLAAGTLFIVETLVERPTYHVGRLLLLGMVVPPWAVNVLYLSGLLPFGGWDPTPLGFAVTGIAGVAAVGRFRLLDVPLARAKVVGDLDTAVLVTAADGTLYDYNERASSLLDVSTADVGAPAGAVLSASPLAVDESVADGAALADVLDGRELSLAADDVPASDGEATGGDDDGDRRFLVRASSLDGGGRPLGYTIQLADITEKHRQHERLREKSRRLEHKNEQLERLAGIVAHDLQTPLSTGRGLLDLLRMDVDTDDPEIAQSLADLERVHDRLDEFAEQLPKLARESTDVDEPVVCDLVTVAREAWDVVDTGPLELAVEGTCEIRGDPVRLRQVFENLFANAAEHAVVADDRDAAADRPEATDGGGESATVVRVGPLDAGGGSTGADDGSTGTGDSADEAAGFFVADDGPGISPDVRGDVAEFGVGTGDGSGFGLAIVRTIVEAHGWTLTAGAADDDGSGARFDVRFGE